jgi:hypothetical protein
MKGVSKELYSPGKKSTVGEKFCWIANSNQIIQVQ